MTFLNFIVIPVISILHHQLQVLITYQLLIIVVIHVHECMLKFISVKVLYTSP